MDLQTLNMMKGMYGDSKLCKTMSFEQFLNHYRKTEDNLDSESLFICEISCKGFISNGGTIPTDFKKWLDETNPKMTFLKKPYVYHNDPEYMSFQWNDLIVIDRYTKKPTSYAPPHCLWDLYDKYLLEKQNIEKLKESDKN